MEIDTRDIDGIVVFTVKGSLTFFSKEQVYTPYHDFLEQGRTKFVFNLQDLDYIDSSGMGVILIGATRLKNEKIRVVGNARVSVIFKMLNAGGFLVFYDSEEEALKSFEK